MMKYSDTEKRSSLTGECGLSYRFHRNEVIQCLENEHVKYGNLLDILAFLEQI